MIKCLACLEDLKVSSEGIKGWRCPKCRGFLAKKSVLATVVEEAKLDAMLDPPESAKNSKRSCAGCGQPYKLVAVGKDKEKTVLDICSSCEYVWFDIGELASLLKVFPRKFINPIAGRDDMSQSEIKAVGDHLESYSATSVLAKFFISSVGGFAIDAFLIGLHFLTWFITEGEFALGYLVYYETAVKILIVIPFSFGFWGIFYFDKVMILRRKVFEVLRWILSYMNSRD